MSDVDVDTPMKSEGASDATTNNNSNNATNINTVDIPPNQTLYLNNLNEKIKVDELKKALYLIFSQFGNIVDVYCKRTFSLRGQAWLIFDSIASATRAMKEMQNFIFYGKIMHVSYAKSKSDVVSKADGSFVKRLKRKGEHDVKGSKSSSSQGNKRQKLSNDAATTSAPVAPPVVEAPTPPHNILFIENLPHQCTDEMLNSLFNQHAGFVEARMIAGKGVAFVEFTEVYQAGNAKEALQGFKITHEHAMKINFAKK